MPAEIAIHPLTASAIVRTFSAWRKGRPQYERYLTEQERGARDILVDAGLCRPEPALPSSGIGPRRPCRAPGRQYPHAHQAPQTGSVKVALVVNRVTPDREANLAAILQAARTAASAGAEWVLLPEAATTGLINNDDPGHDLPLGEPIPGPVTDALGAMARERRIWLATGLLEREGNCLYDSAVLLAPSGEIALHYRRIEPHWHGQRADPAIYRQGRELPLAYTPLGKVAFLICGDLFDDAILRRLRDSGPDWLLFPFARCFSPGSCEQTRWDAEEEPCYLQRISQANCTTLMANYLADRSLQGGAFGGAWVVSGQGQVIARLPLGRAGILLVDLPPSTASTPATGVQQNAQILWDC